LAASHPPDVAVVGLELVLVFGLLIVAVL